MPTSSDAILVTGGAGYIGSHAVLALRDAGHSVVVIDDLSNGFRSAVPEGVPLVVGSVGDRPLLDRVLADEGIGAVMHFAGSIVVPESVSDPLKYFGNNTVNSHTLIAACVDHGVRDFIFSSTAAVYGMPETLPIDEESPTRPINPYGTSKLMIEWMLRDTAAATDLRYAALRYFNVAGADPDGRSGQSTPVATHLIKIACQAALGLRPNIQVFGTDYATADGTAIRDYIHVTDLADAHVLALQHLRKGGDSLTLNCGYGHGLSVREVLQAVEQVAGHPLPIVEAPRRAGDSPALVAASERVRQVLGWRPRLDDLQAIVSSALAWERKRPHGPQSEPTVPADHLGKA